MNWTLKCTAGDWSKLNLQAPVLKTVFDIKHGKYLQPSCGWMLKSVVPFCRPPGQLYGLEKFWAFLKYSKIKNQPIDPKLQGHLSQFKNLEDFRVVVSVHAGQQAQMLQNIPWFHLFCFYDMFSFRNSNVF